VIAPAVAALLSTGLLHLALGDVVTWDLSLQGETRGRVASVGERRGEVTAEPRAGLGLVGRLHSANAAYAPQLRLDSGSATATVLHVGAVSGAWRLDPRWQATAVATGSYGERDFLLGDRPALATGGAAVPVQPIPALTSVRYGAGALRVGLGGALTPRHPVLLGAQVFAEGGVGPAAGAVLPMQRGVAADGSLGWTLSRADALSAALNGTVTTFPATGARSAAAALTTSWRHAFTPRTGGWLGAGPTWASETGSDSVVAVGGEAGVQHRLVRPAVDAALSTRVAPIIDRITGSVYQRVDFTGTASWAPAVRWLVSGTTASGVVLDGPQRGERVASAEARAGWSSMRRWSLSGGVRWMGQDGGPAPLSRVDEWTAFVGVGVREHGRL
jgi:hypothetical protein